MEKIDSIHGEGEQSPAELRYFFLFDLFHKNINEPAVINQPTDHILCQSTMKNKKKWKKKNIYNVVSIKS